MRGEPNVMPRRPSRNGRNLGQFRNTTYAMRAGLAQEYIHVFEGGACQTNHAAAVPAAGAARETLRDFIVPSSRADLVTVYLDLWNIPESSKASFGRTLRDRTQALATAISAKQLLHAKDLDYAGVRVGLNVDRGRTAGRPTAHHRISLWISHLTESKRNKAIMLLLDDKHAMGPASEQATCGEYEALSGASGYYRLATLFRELRPLWEYDVQTQYSMAADAACLEYRRLTGRLINRDIVWRAMQAMARHAPRHLTQRR